MRKVNHLLTIVFLGLGVMAVSGQTGQPSAPAGPYVVKTKQEISAITDLLKKQDGNKQEDIVAASGKQMRVAVFHDEKRVNDLFEVHDHSDDIYYVLEGTATLLLGGNLVDPNEISPGEWRAKAANGTKEVVMKKGDVVMVPRGTVHQRTVTGKGLSMILIKVFSDNQ